MIVSVSSDSAPKFTIGIRLQYNDLLDSYTMLEKLLFYLVPFSPLPLVHQLLELHEILNKEALACAKASLFAK